MRSASWDFLHLAEAKMMGSNGQLRRCQERHPQLRINTRCEKKKKEEALEKQKKIKQKPLNQKIRKP